MRLLFKRARYTRAVQPSATTRSRTAVEESGRPAFDIEEPHGAESYAVERTQLIMACAGPREDVNCYIITTATRGDRVMEIQLI